MIIESVSSCLCRTRREIKWVHFLNHQCKISGNSMQTEVEIQHTCKKETD